MRSIVYAGHDFSECCSAEVMGRTVTPVAAEVMEVPGRAGALLVSGRVPPVDVTVRLFLDAGFRADVVRLAEVRHRLSFWLCVPGGGELRLPDEPGRAYRDALLVDAGAWDELFSDGKCDVTFTLFDPIAFGDERVERTASFEVGGTWATLPRFQLVAAAGAGLSVSCPAIGRGVSIDYEFAGGEAVVIDCADESVRIDGGDARDRVALGSDFFALEPGGVELAFSGCTSHEARFSERWV